TIEFPRDCEFAADGAIYHPPRLYPALVAGELDQPSPYALVVEDDADSQRLIERLLGESSRVLAAASADEARSMREAHRVKIILMDLSLRGSEDGLTLTRKLREDARYEKTPIVALTAHVTSYDRQRAYSAGCDAYISKPVDQTELFATIAELSSARSEPAA